MLSRLRHLFIDSWVGRIAVGLIFIAFMGWGGMDVWTNFTHQDANVVAWVGHEKITLPELDHTARNQMQTISVQKGLSDSSQLSDNAKKAIINETLQQLIIQNIFLDQANQLGLSVPDSVLRDAVFSMAIFQQNGQFNRDLLKSFLSQRNMTEENFLNLIKDQIELDGLLNPLMMGVASSDIIAELFYQFRNEKRGVSYVDIFYDSYRSKTIPTESVLKRYYENHRWQFTTPEFRRIKLVYISPETVAKDIDVTDQEIQKFYDSRKNYFIKPESKTLQIVTVQDEKVAKSLLEQWKGGDWQSLQKKTKEQHGFASLIPDFNQKNSTSSVLTQAVFKATPNQISGPIKNSMGWSIFKVLSTSPEQMVPLSQVKENLKNELVQSKAKQAFVDNIKKIQDILAGGEGLDAKLGGLGLVAVEGTLNEQGYTPEGQLAPIGLPEKVQQEILTKIFSTAQHNPVSLIQAAENIYYAFNIETIEPAHQDTYQAAKDKIIEAWQKAEAKRQANIMATNLYLTASKSKDGVSNLKTNLSVQQSPLFSREEPAKIILPALQQQSFIMKAGQSTMMETPNGFVVATLTKCIVPSKNDNPVAYNSVKQSLSQSLSDDIAYDYKNFIQKNIDIKVNQQALDALIKQVNY
ncbi:Chaperone SurA [Commensalibacter sp. Nvir]|uniref:peptidyl-prolyl cis-trans isomerase n=1 Tax=Commensalibacter sp. Nvir TaxID=3069817 RepID=UPI002D4D9D11|nr:Chaperone SurA [Commensalibacter sp. Nvir]